MRFGLPLARLLLVGASGVALAAACQQRRDLAGEAPPENSIDGSAASQVDVETARATTEQRSARARPAVLGCAHEGWPATAVDGQGRHWLVTRCQGPERHLRLFEVDQQGRRLVATLPLEGATGLGAPAIAAQGDTVAVVAAIEHAGRWRLGWAQLSASAPTSASLAILELGDALAVRPVLAPAEKGWWLSWEAGSTARRQVRVARVDAKGVVATRSLSAADADSHHPALVALDDGSLLAAWDSLREDNVDLYGAWFTAGAWSAEQRLTRDPRVERHASLAVHAGQVWLAWQAQSFPGRHLHLRDEQRIVVARLTPEGLHGAVGLFEEVSTRARRLARPTLSFDTSGALWLAAHATTKPYDERLLVVYRLVERTWTPVPLAIAEGHLGRGQPAVFLLGRQGGQIATQVSADIPLDDVEPRAEAPWPSTVELFSLPGVATPPRAAPATTPLRMPGTTFDLQVHRRAQAVDLPRQRRVHADRTLQLFWGDLHNHSDISVCERTLNPPLDDLLDALRDIEGLDFTAVTDHGYNLTAEQWAWSREQVSAACDDGRFVALLGQEWTSDTVAYSPPRAYTRYGHRNLISFTAPAPQAWDAHREPMSPGELWSRLAGLDVIAIPHQLADTRTTAVDWTFHDEALQPVAEIFQTMGSFEALGAPRQAPTALRTRGHYLQDLWAQGLVIGVTASPDHGGGLGKTGVWAETLDREALSRALRARRRFGTTGAKIALLVSAGPDLMGDKVVRAPGEHVALTIWAAALSPVSGIEILRDNQVVQRWAPDQTTIELGWRDPRPLTDAPSWYYVRLRVGADQLAWSSPIWFYASVQDRDATVARARALRVRHPGGPPAAARSAP